jgi:hypothetical protein
LGKEKAMSANNESYVRYVHENGEEYYCPLDASGEDKRSAGWDEEACVEASTVGRYSGNLAVTDRFIY